MKRSKSKQESRYLCLAAVSSAIVSLTPAWVHAQEKYALEEVIVTAQKREQSLQDVPIAVTAMTGQMMADAGIQNVEDLATASPSIAFAQASSSATSSELRIRGIGTAGNARVFEGAVGVFIDGVYRSRVGMALANLVDVGSIEVLRGPQGTLFGKNTSAGALTVRSAAPSPDEFHGQLELGVGNYDALSFKGAANIPVSENSALRIAGLSSVRDGFIEDFDTSDDYHNNDRLGFKLQYLTEPTDTLSVRLIADYNESDEHTGSGTVRTGFGPVAPLVAGLSAANGRSYPLAADPSSLRTSQDSVADSVVEDKGISLDISWDIGDYTLRSITAYREFDFDQKNLDADFSPAAIFTLDEKFNTETFSQEFLFSGQVGAFAPFESADFVLGVYFANEELEAGRQLINGAQGDAFWNASFTAQGVPGFPLPPGLLAPEGLAIDEAYKLTDDVFAIFNHWTFSLNDKLGMVLGLRYSEEEKEGGYDEVFFDWLAFSLIGNGPNHEYRDSTKDEEFTGNLHFQYFLDNGSMAYAGYSRGFKAGGVNLDLNAAGPLVSSAATGSVPLPPTDPTYAPEFVDSYEIGLKSEYWDGRARTNLSLFYTELEDIQFSVFLDTFFTVQNAGKAKSNGIEIENTFLVSERLDLDLAVTWLNDASYGNDAPNLENRDFSHAPEWAGSAALNYEQDIGANLSGFLRLALSYKGEHFTGASTNEKQNAFLLTNFNLGVKSIDGAWETVLWCKNCFDEDYITQHIATPLQPGTFDGYVGNPRQIGVTLRANF